MKLRADQLGANLKRGLAPVYLVSGDEPLQIGEAVDTIRLAARAAGHSEREVLDVESHFDWSSLDAAAGALSLFAEKRIIELRLPTGKPGKEGGEALVRYAQRPADDAVLLIIAGRIDGQAQRAKWYKTVDGAGVTIPVYPVEVAELPAWIARRMQSRGMHFERDVPRLLAERGEGNLLAAAQEIEKLALLYGEEEITLDSAAAAVADSSRFNAFDMADAALAGQGGRAVRMLNGLRAEGSYPLAVLGPLGFALRQSYDLSRAAAARQPLDGLFKRNGIWKRSRQNAIRSAIKRHRPRDWAGFIRHLAEADQAVKGMSPYDPWELMSELMLSVAGQSLTLRR